MSRVEVEKRCQQVFEEFGPHEDWADCAGAIEGQLRVLAETPFHRAIGRTFLHHIESVADYLIDYFQVCSPQKPVMAIYFEMNGFACNTDMWFCNAFAESVYEGSENGYQWVAEWCSDEIGRDFPLSGMEDIQKAFAADYRGEWCGAWTYTEYLIIARFNELIASAQAAAKRREPSLVGMPIIYTAHDQPEWTVGESK